MAKQKLLIVTVALALVACEKVAEVPAAPADSTAGSYSSGGKTQMPELAVKHNCVYCHLIDKRKIGPSWMEISERYKGATEYSYYGEKHTLEDGLTIKISKGGGGIWGQMPMPANDPGGVKEADMRQLTRFILALSK